MVSEGSLIGLILVAGAFHALWNLAAKRVGGDRMLYFTAINLLVALLTAPWALTHLPSGDLGYIAGLVLVRGALNALYLFGLGKAYAALDLSLVYPLVRGGGPLVTALLAVILLGERPGVLGLSGVAVTSLAIWSIALTAAPGPDSVASPGTTRQGIPWVVITAVTVGCYTVVDKAAVGAIDPLTYLCLIEGISGLIFAAPITVRRRWPELAGAVRAAPGSVLLCIAGFVTSYCLFLVALRYGYATYLAPLREVAVLYAVLLGIFVLREPHGARRLPAAAGIAAGLILVGLAL